MVLSVSSNMYRLGFLSDLCSKPFINLLNKVSSNRLYGTCLVSVDHYTSSDELTFLMESILGPLLEGDLVALSQTLFLILDL